MIRINNKNINEFDFKNNDIDDDVIDTIKYKGFWYKNRKSINLKNLKETLDNCQNILLLPLTNRKVSKSNDDYYEDIDFYENEYESTYLSNVFMLFGDLELKEYIYKNIIDNKLDNFKYLINSIKIYQNIFSQKIYDKDNVKLEIFEKYIEFFQYIQSKFENEKNSENNILSDKYKELLKKSSFFLSEYRYIISSITNNLFFNKANGSIDSNFFNEKIKFIINEKTDNDCVLSALNNLLNSEDFINKKLIEFGDETIHESYVDLLKLSNFLNNKNKIKFYENYISNFLYDENRYYDDTSEKYLYKNALILSQSLDDNSILTFFKCSRDFHYKFINYFLKEKKYKTQLISYDVKYKNKNEKISDSLDMYNNSFSKILKALISPEEIYNKNDISIKDNEYKKYFDDTNELNKTRNYLINELEKNTEKMEEFNKNDNDVFQYNKVLSSYLLIEAILENIDISSENKKDESLRNIEQFFYYFYISNVNSNEIDFYNLKSILNLKNIINDEYIKEEFSSLYFKTFLKYLKGKENDEKEYIIFELLRNNNNYVKDIKIFITENRNHFIYNDNELELFLIKLNQFLKDNYNSNLKDVFKNDVNYLTSIFRNYDVYNIKFLKYLGSFENKFYFNNVFNKNNFFKNCISPIKVYQYLTENCDINYTNKDKLTLIEKSSNMKFVNFLIDELKESDINKEKILLSLINNHKILENITSFNSFVQKEKELLKNENVSENYTNAIHEILNYRKIANIIFNVPNTVDSSSLYLESLTYINKHLNLFNKNNYDNETEFNLKRDDINCDLIKNNIHVIGLKGYSIYKREINNLLNIDNKDFYKFYLIDIMNNKNFDFITKIQDEILNCYKSNPHSFEKDITKSELIYEVRNNIDIIKQKKDKMYKDRVGYGLFNNDDAKVKFFDKIDEIINQNENFNFHNHKKTLLYFFNNYEKDINDIKNDMKDMLNVFILNNLFNVNETENINKNINNFVNIFAPKNISKNKFKNI